MDQLSYQHPVRVGTRLTKQGHIVVIKGYAEDGDAHYYIVNDPLKGKNLLFTWDQLMVTGILTAEGEPSPEVPTWLKIHANPNAAQELNAFSFQKTMDGGFIVAGETIPPGGTNLDCFVMKLKGAGDIDWSWTFGNPNNSDSVSSIQQTLDGNYIVAGRTILSANYEAYVAKLDGSSGVPVWHKTYGSGLGNDIANAIIPVKTGGYIVVGSTESMGDFKSHIWVLRLDENGNVIRQKTYDGGYYASGISILEATDGYIIAGHSRFSAGEQLDVWLLKINDPFSDEEGIPIWEKRYGLLSTWDYVSSIQKTKDGGIILVGATNAKNYSGVMVLRLDSDGNIIPQKAKVYINGNDNMWDDAQSVLETADGGYIIAGNTHNNTSGLTYFFVMKLDSNLSVVWQKAYDYDLPSKYFMGFDSIQETADGGYALLSSSGYADRIGILKLDGNGEIPGCNIMVNTNFVEYDLTLASQGTNAIIEPLDYNMTEQSFPAQKFFPGAIATCE